MSRTNLDVFYYLVDRECNKALVYLANMYKPEVVYLAMRFGISNKKAAQYVAAWKQEMKAVMDESNA